jgi:hypothetical protein
MVTSNLADVNVPGVATFVTDVRAERRRQLEKWGDQRHPNGTGVTPQQRELADVARAACQQVFAEGDGTWAHVLMEEVCEALAESEVMRLREELIQVAAVCAAWIWNLDQGEALRDEASTQPDML